jgi:anti-sigma factor RsiW
VSEHEEIRELLALAAANALSEDEARAVQDHLRSCEGCAAELQQWSALGKSLRRLPTPQAPAHVVERTRMQMRFALEERGARRSEQWSVALVLVFAWAVTIAGWPVMRFLSDGVLGWTNWGLNSTWFGVAMYAGLGWAIAGVAAAVLAAHRGERPLAMENGFEEKHS